MKIKIKINIKILILPNYNHKDDIKYTTKTKKNWMK